MVKKSNFDSFQKVVFYSLPVVGLCMTGNNLKYFYTILLPLLEENFEKLSKTQKGHIFTKKSIIKNLKALSLANISQTWSYFKMLFSKEHIFLQIFVENGHILANVLSKKQHFFRCWQLNF